MKMIPTLDSAREYVQQAKDTVRIQGENVSRAVRTNTLVVAIVGLVALVALMLGVRAVRHA
jgi:hypothetical protein